MNWKFWQSSGHKSKTREWIDALVFAVIAATIIRTFFIEAFTIPTPSMEKSLMVGDFLFVSKVSYGPRTPMTPLSFPFAHQEMPIIGGKSYSEIIKLPYYRLPGFAKIKNNDVVVFNYPMEDDRPVDKQTHYIKRCIGIPGDSLKIIDRLVYINNKPAELVETGQYTYEIKTDGGGINSATLEKLDVTEGGPAFSLDSYRYLLSKNAETEIRKMKNVKSIEPVVQAKGQFEDYIFPFDPKLPWNVDNFGTIYIPKTGDKIELNANNIAIYRRAIATYEHNKLEEKDGKIFINDQEVTHYTFKMGYFWMMGDNRHNSADSRFWGFVPDDHIVGKAVFIWMSWNTNGTFLHKIRWNRLFNFIH